MAISKTWKIMPLGHQRALPELSVQSYGRQKGDELLSLRRMTGFSLIGLLLIRKKAARRRVMRSTSSWSKKYACSCRALSSSLTLNVLQNSRHPWQAWRDRWIKNLQDKPRPAPILQRGSPAARSDQAVGVEITKQRKHIPGKTKEQATEFSQEDLESLLGEAEGILNIHPERISDAWAAWAGKVSLLHCI